MKPKENDKKEAIKFAASLGINLTVGNKPSEKIYFPEKVELANDILSKTKFIHKK
jgi:hypothetical protein